MIGIFILDFFPNIFSPQYLNIVNMRNCAREENDYFLPSGLIFMKCPVRFNIFCHFNCT